MLSEQKLGEQKLADMAQTYREMAQQAATPGLRFDFAERAERYETALAAVRRAKVAAPQAGSDKPRRPEEPDGA